MSSTKRASSDERIRSARTATGVGVVLVLLGITTIAITRAAVFAQAPATTRAAAMTQDEISSAVRTLIDPDPARRDVARERLLSLDRDSIAQIRRAAIDAGNLNPAQVDAIGEVVMHVYLKTEPYESNPAAGFLGISMMIGDDFRRFNGEASGPEIGIAVGKRWPGYGAYESLCDGDVILRVVERPGVLLQNQFALRDALSDLPGGNVVHLELLRAGKVMTVPVRLSPRPVRVDAQMGFEPDQAVRTAKALDFFKREFGEFLRDPDL